MTSWKGRVLVSILFELVKENTRAVAPIALIVVSLNLTLVPLGLPLILRFLVGAILIIIGLSLFLLALDLGISRLRKDSKASEEDSFGLVAIASAGAIMTVMVLNIIIGTQGYAVASLEPIKLESIEILRPFP